MKRLYAIRPSEITAETNYLGRRRFLRWAGAAAMAAVNGDAGAALFGARPAPPPGRPDFPHLRSSPLSTGESPTGWQEITTYNNFYELGTGKGDPAANAHLLRSDPWSVAIEGEVARGGRYHLEDLLRGVTLEERIYRLRCVEGWSMVIPWVGFPLATLLTRFKPTSRAKYVEFTALHAPALLPGQRLPFLNWPYREGLRMDEAMHPLTIVAVGLYGRILPPQNGAPLRLVVPWKYGFKSIKSIVRIRLTEKLPRTTWNEALPEEFGFYANVNPEVDHPRWGQRKERRIGEFFKRDTLPFNGYGEQVAHLYAGMDLRRNF